TRDMSAARSIEARALRDRREMSTPEGITLPIALASRSTRLGALLIDLTIIFAFNLGLSILVQSIAFTILGEDDLAQQGAILEFLQVLLIIGSFLLLNGYFMFFELGPR